MRGGEPLHASAHNRDALSARQPQGVVAPSSAARRRHQLYSGGYLRESSGASTASRARRPLGGVADVGTRSAVDRRQAVLRSACRRRRHRRGLPQETARRSRASWADRAQVADAAGAPGDRDAIAAHRAAPAGERLPRQMRTAEQASRAGEAESSQHLTTLAADAARPARHRANSQALRLRAARRLPGPDARDVFGPNRLVICEAIDRGPLVAWHPPARGAGWFAYGRDQSFPNRYALPPRLMAIPPPHRASRPRAADRAGSSWLSRLR
jgi:hypothetical protein